METLVASGANDQMVGLASVAPKTPAFHVFGSGAKRDPVYLMCTRLWPVSLPAGNRRVLHCFYTLIIVAKPKVRRRCITKSRCSFPTSK